MKVYARTPLDLDQIVLPRGRVYVIPDNPISRPSQNLTIALEMLSRAFHPDIFGEFEIME